MDTGNLQSSLVKSWPSSRSGATHILIVDEDDVLRRALLMRLSRSGYSVTAASCADQALLALENGGIDFVLADDTLSGKTTGAMFGRIVRKLWPAAKTILMTGRDSSQLPDADSLEGFPLLRKPFSSEDLACVLDRLKQAA
jgi:DNA-binding NtrC family response regulator